MRHRTNSIGLFLTLAALAGAGCSSARERGSVETPSSPSVTLALPSLGIAPRNDLETCLAAGGELVMVGEVDNNDQADHGALLTFGISRGGLLAAAGADGTLKFWSFDEELLATVDGSALTYGSEVGAVPITDVAFGGDEAAITADVRGLVSSMSADGSFYVLGGTTPDVPIVAVAFDEGTERIAHAQSAADVVPLVIRAIGSVEEGAEPVIEIGDTLDEITDLGFSSRGDLLVAGGHGGAAAIEIRGAADLRTVRARVQVHGAPYVELALAPEGDLGAAIAPGRIDLLRDDAIERTIDLGEDAPASVDVTPSGAIVFSAGARGELVAHRTSDGVELARVRADAPVRVRVDPTGRRVIVGSSDALLHAFACTR